MLALPSYPVYQIGNSAYIIHCKISNENKANDHTQQFTVSNLKNETLPTSSLRNHRDSLGEFTNTSNTINSVFGAERVEKMETLKRKTCIRYP